MLVSYRQDNQDAWRIVKDVLVKVGKFIFPVDFIVLNFEEDEDVPLILGMTFMYTTKEIIYVFEGTLTLRVGGESCKFDVYQGMKHPPKLDNCMRIDMVDDCVDEVQRGRLAKSCDLEDVEKCL